MLRDGESPPGAFQGLSWAEVDGRRSHLKRADARPKLRRGANHEAANYDAYNHDKDRSVMMVEKIARVQEYLRKTFDNNRMRILPPKKDGQPIEVYIGEEFIGTIDADDEDGEMTFFFQVAILEEDLPDL